MQFRQCLRKTSFKYLHQKAELNQTFLVLSFDDLISKLCPLFLVPFRTIVLGSVRLSVRLRLSVRHIKILSCPDFFLRPLIYWLDIWYVAISRWVTVYVRISVRSKDFWL